MTLHFDQLTEEEKLAAEEAVYKVRDAAHTKAVAELPTPSYQNTLGAKTSIGVEELLGLALKLGYDYFIWNGWVYPTITKSLESHPKYLVEVLEHKCIACGVDISDQTVCWQCA